MKITKVVEKSNYTGYSGAVILIIFRAGLSHMCAVCDTRHILTLLDCRPIPSFVLRRKRKTFFGKRIKGIASSFSVSLQQRPPNPHFSDEMQFTQTERFQNLGFVISGMCGGHGGGGGAGMGHAAPII